MVSIKNIKELCNFSFNDSKYSSTYDGYKIECEDESNLLFLIRNGQACCENWGYLISEDDLDQFIGATIQNVTLTDDSLKSVELKLSKEINTEDLYNGGAIFFVNIHTDRGLLQFVAYNVHNGYYGHQVKIVSNFLNYSTIL